MMMHKVPRTWTTCGLLVMMIAISGCAGLFNRGVEEAPREDVIVAMKVKAALIEKTELDAAAIHVEATKGVVTLSGFVETESQRQLASKMAQQVPGVEQVDNKIQVK